MGVLAFKNRFVGFCSLKPSVKPICCFVKTIQAMVGPDRSPPEGKLYRRVHFFEYLKRPMEWAPPLLVALEER